MLIGFWSPNVSSHGCPKECWLFCLFVCVCSFRFIKKERKEKKKQAKNVNMVLAVILLLLLEGGGGGGMAVQSWREV